MAETHQAGPLSAPADLTGRTVGDFAILRCLGQGGMGQVYLADQISLKRKVALKFLRPDHAANPVALKRFQAEAEAVARVTHANIVQVYAIGEANGLQYMALEYVEGRNLKDYLNRKGPPELPAALSMMRQVAAALQRASESGLVHRDVKPENILLTRKGEVKVADFGLSRFTEQDLNLTQSGMTLGTPLYMSPEQVQGGAIDPRSDIYSFGVTCYHMFAGRPPFQGQNAFDVALQHVQAEPPPLAELRPDLPAALVALIHTMMSKDPALRPQTGREIVRALNAMREAANDNPFAGIALAGPVGGSGRLEEPATAVTPPPSASLTVPVAARRRPVRPAVLLGLSVLLSLFCGVVLRLVLSAQGTPAPVTSAEETQAAKALPSDRERFLLLAVKEFASPRLEKVREGVGHHIDLGALYLRQRRFDDAERLFRGMKAPGGPPIYQSVAMVGAAVLLSLRDDVDGSNKLFGELNSRRQELSRVLFAANVPVDAAIELRYWVREALFRNETRKPLPAPLTKIRDQLDGRLPPPSKGKAG